MNELVTEERSWWSRNWKWVVPVGGCFTFIVIGILVLGGAIFGFVKSVQNDSGGNDALEIAKSNPQVMEVLGEPITKDGMGSYSVNYKNGYKTSEAIIPIEGPNGTATLRVKTSGSDDALIYEVFEIQVDNTGELIDLNQNQLDQGAY